jgi:hypothetical protein
MKSLRRWNRAMSMIVILAGFTIPAETAFADPPICPTDACADSCAFVCWQDGCLNEYCGFTCYDNTGIPRPYSQQCWP